MFWILSPFEIKVTNINQITTFTEIQSRSFRPQRALWWKLPPYLHTTTPTISVGKMPKVVDRDSSDGIATRYGLDGSGIEFRWGRDIPHPSRPSLGPTQPPIQWETGLFPGIKRAGAWSWPPTPSNAEVKERVQLYFYSPCRSSWPVLGWTLPLPFYLDYPTLTFTVMAG
jgi:hypothetical protein